MLKRDVSMAGVRGTFLEEFIFHIPYAVSMFHLYRKITHGEIQRKKKIISSEVFGF